MPTCYHPPEMAETMYDPVKRGLALEKVVSEGDSRRYYRFRPARWYGGIATGDVTGCNLLCCFCWAGDRIRNNPGKIGRLYSPETAFDRLESIARKKDFPRMRLSGQEPTLGREHLLRLLEMLEGQDHIFILETNGIMIGHDESYATALSPFRNLRVRVSIKGASGEEFTELTGAGPKGLELQLKSLEHLHDAGVDVWPAVMAPFSSKESIGKLVQRIAEMDRGLARELEIEELLMYPHVRKRLNRHGMGP